MPRRGRKPKIEPSVFFKPRSKRLSRIISIKNPRAFRSSVRKLNRSGLTVKEKRALVLARTRARLQLRRKNLSPKERRQFRMIASTKLPPATRKSARGPRLRVPR